MRRLNFLSNWSQAFRRRAHQQYIDTLKQQLNELMIERDIVERDIDIPARKLAMALIQNKPVAR